MIITQEQHLRKLVNTGLPQWLSDKESACNEGDMGSIPGLGRSPRRGAWQLYYSWLENPRGQRSPVGDSPQDHKESDVTKATEQAGTLFYQLEIKTQLCKFFEAEETMSNDILLTVCVILI